MVTRPSRRSGISLIELLAASVVLVGLATSAAWVGPAQLRGIVRCHEEAVAERVALARLEAFRAEARAVPGTRAFAPVGLEPTDLPGAAATETVGDAGPGLVRVEVEVAWDAADGGRGRLVLTTLLAQETPR